MIKASDLPAVRARADGTLSAVDEPAAPLVVDPAPCYPSKKLVLDNGRYVVVEPTK